jgi:hypothetical protein
MGLLLLRVAGLAIGFLNANHSHLKCKCLNGINLSVLAMAP